MTDFYRVHDTIYLLCQVGALQICPRTGTSFLSFTADIPVSQKEYKVYCSIFVVQNKLVYVATYLEIPHQYVPR